MARFQFARNAMTVDHGDYKIGDVADLPDDVAARYARIGWGSVIKEAESKPAVKQRASRSRKADG